jgi:hypothetical protein
MLCRTLGNTLACFIDRGSAQTCSGETILPRGASLSVVFVRDVGKRVKVGARSEALARKLPAPFVVVSAPSCEISL